MAATPLRLLFARGLKALGGRADSDSDSRLGTDGNQPGLELREGAADDAALLIAQEQDLRAQILLARTSFETLAAKVALVGAGLIPQEQEQVQIPLARTPFETLAAKVALAQAGLIAP